MEINKYEKDMVIIKKSIEKLAKNKKDTFEKNE